MAVSDQRLNLSAFREQVERGDKLVRCVRCSKIIPVSAERCPECGVHFQGDAGEIAREPDRAQSLRRKRAVVALVAIVLVMAIVAAMLM